MVPDTAVRSWPSPHAQVTLHRLSHVRDLKEMQLGCQSGKSHHTVGFLLFGVPELQSSLLHNRCTSLVMVYCFRESSWPACSAGSNEVFIYLGGGLGTNHLVHYRARSIYDVIATGLTYAG